MASLATNDGQVKTLGAICALAVKQFNRQSDSGDTPDPALLEIAIAALAHIREIGVSVASVPEARLMSAWAPSGLKKAEVIRSNFRGEPDVFVARALYRDEYIVTGGCDSDVAAVEALETILKGKAN